MSENDQNLPDDQPAVEPPASAHPAPPPPPPQSSAPAPSATYPNPVAAAPPAGAAAAAGNGFSIAGIVCGAISLFLFWFIFGPLGLVLGAVGKSRGEQKANTAMIVSAIGTIGGGLFMLLIL